MQSKAKLLIVFLLILSAQLAAETDSLRVERQQRNYDMKPFDKETFEKNRTGLDYKFETEYESVRQFRFNDVYIEDRYNKLKAFSTQTAYWTKSLNPKQITYSISDCIVGKIKYFDINGRLEKEIDADAPFKKDIYWVGDFILRTEGVDMFEPETDKRRLMINRTDGVANPYYEVRFNNKDNQAVFYQIDATTGEVMRKVVAGKVKVANPYANGVIRPEQEKERKKANRKNWLGF